MPYFNHLSITVATRRSRLLVVAADRWDTESESAPFNLDVSRLSPAHFGRRITFGWDADMARIRAEFDGQVLHVSVPRRSISTAMGLPRTNTNRASAPASGVGAMRYNPLEMSVPPELEMTRSHSSQSQDAPHRRDVAWPLG